MRLNEVPICHSHLLTGRRSAPDSDVRRSKRQAGRVAGPHEMASPRLHHTLTELTTRARGMENVASDERAQPLKDIESVPPRYNDMCYRATLENTRDQINGQETQRSRQEEGNSHRATTELALRDLVNSCGASFTSWRSISTGAYSFLIKSLTKAGTPSFVLSHLTTLLVQWCNGDMDDISREGGVGVRVVDSLNWDLGLASASTIR